MSLFPSEYDDDYVRELIQRHRSGYEELARINERQRETEEEIDRCRATFKPRVPSEEQITGLDAAAAAMHDQYEAKSHLGDPMGDTYTVTLGNWRTGPGYYRVGIRHKAPFSARGSHKLWHFEDHEVQWFIKYLEGHGCKFVESWKHDEGVSIVVKRPGMY